jgi:hypothetical protein
MEGAALMRVVDRARHGDEQAGRRPRVGDEARHVAGERAALD